MQVYVFNINCVFFLFCFQDKQNHEYFYFGVAIGLYKGTNVY